MNSFLHLFSEFFQRLSGICIFYVTQNFLDHCISTTSSIDEVDNIIESLRKEHKKCRHIVYAYKFDNIEKNHADKEPNGTTRGLIDIIHRKNLNKTLIVVIRYFGGTLLGSGLLTRTYTKVSSMLFIE